MKSVKFAMMGMGVLAAAVALAHGVLSHGAHGVIVLVGCLLPVAFGVMSLARKRGLPRWASILSIICFLVVGMKTTEGDFQDVMLVVFFATFPAIVLAIKPDKPEGGPTPKHATSSLSAE